MKGDLNLSPICGIPENAGVTYQHLPLLGRLEGRGDVGDSDFVPFFGDPRECRGYVAILPTFGLPRRQG